MVHSLEISDEVYENFQQLKDMISDMTQEKVKEQELLSLMIQEFTTSVEMMQKEGISGEDDHECCGGNGGDDCCGEGHCHH